MVNRYLIRFLRLTHGQDVRYQRTLTTLASTRSLCPSSAMPFRSQVRVPEDPRLDMGPRTCARLARAMSLMI
jgi:hypothetical protein